MLRLLSIRVYTYTFENMGEENIIQEINDAFNKSDIAAVEFKNKC